MSDQPVEVVINELVLHGVEVDMAPLIVRAIEMALAAVPEIGADQVPGLVSGAVADALRTGRQG